MVFRFSQKILFKHCDPAGIVFYPRYFEMINDCVEAFFCTEVEWPFEIALRFGGLPTAEISTRFTAPSRHGDELILELRMEKLGETSIHLNIIALNKEEQRFIATSRLVRVGRTGRPEGWPDFVRSRFREIMEGQHDKQNDPT